MGVTTENVKCELCPKCTNSFSSWRVKNTIDKSYNIDRCGSCGYAFVNARLVEGSRAVIDSFDWSWDRYAKDFE